LVLLNFIEFFNKFIELCRINLNIKQFKVSLSTIWVKRMFLRSWDISSLICLMFVHDNEAKEKNCGMSSDEKWYEFSFQNFLKIAKELEKNRQ